MTHRSLQSEMHMYHMYAYVETIYPLRSISIGYRIRHIAAIRHMRINDEISRSYYSLFLWNPGMMTIGFARSKFLRGRVWVFCISCSLNPNKLCDSANTEIIIIYNGHFIQFNLTSNIVRQTDLNIVNKLQSLPHSSGITWKKPTSPIRLR